MTDVEQLLREALSDIPAPSSPAVDPLAAVDRRVRRARRGIAVGAAVAVASVVAAVAVPLSLTGGHRASDVQVGRTPSPSPSAKGGVPSEVVTTVVRTGAVSVSSSDGGPAYALGRSKTGDGSAYVATVQAGHLTDRVPVPAPADNVVADTDIAWVTGNSLATGRARITAVHPAAGTKATVTEPGEVVAATVAADSLFVLRASRAGVEVERFVTDDTGVVKVASHRIAFAAGIVTDAGGTAWVSTPNQLIPLRPQAQDFGFGPAVAWHLHQPVFGPAPPSGLWAYDGRLVELTPPLLHTGVSVAEGWRLDTGAAPAAVASAPGGVYYGVSSAASATDNGVFYYSRRSMSDGAARPDAGLGGFPVSALTADPDGGVLFVTSSALQHWTPAATGSR
jgi:hypothetical protein